METLFRIFTPRKVALFIAILALASLGRRYAGRARAWYLARVYPPVGGPSRAGADISAQWQKEQSGRVALEYQKVSALLAAAEKQGFQVDGLKAEASAAMALNTPAYHRQALQILSKVEFSIPQKQ